MLLTRLCLAAAASLVGLASAQSPGLQPPAAIHYVIERRGGAFAPNWTANLTYLAEELRVAEARFNFTRREVRSNKIVRVPKERAVGGGEVSKLIGEYGRLGNWFARLRIGTPPQKVHLDIDMLTRDFSLTTTSSALGSRFEDFFSTSYAENPLKLHAFTGCGFPSDKIALPTVNRSVSISFPHCKPRRQSLDTLLPSGAIFGLAPSSSLGQMDENLPTFIKQLMDLGLVTEEVVSLTLISGEEGILSVGGTIQEAIAHVEAQIENHLGKPQSLSTGPVAPQPAPNGFENNPFNPVPASGPPAPVQMAKRDLNPGQEVRDDGMAQQVPTFEDLNPFNRAGRMKTHTQHLPSWKDGWKWSPVEGAAGWWQILMRGVWTDQVKVMKNQPCILDINTPFILAPPLAAKAFYASISGSHRLPAPYSNFYAYPCNNPPYLHFEFGGWRFPVMRGTKSQLDHRGANGKFSLGKVSDDSGYCVGAVVETRMGVGDASPIKKSNLAGGQREAFFGGGVESSMLAGNGLRDVWVLGEPVFRGMGLVFDMKTKEVGFRTY